MQSFDVVEFGKPLQRRDQPDPVPTGTEVLVRITGCGVCHSDLHLWDGYFDLGGGKRIDLKERGSPLPLVMGHEIGGEVLAVGPEAKGVEPGQRIVVFPWIGCGKCAACERGDDLMCLSPQTLGVRRAGGYADRVLVPHPRYLLDHEGVDGALACTYACSGLTAFSALRKAGDLTAEDVLLVIGAGGVGLSAVHLASSVTPARVVVADIDPKKRDAALAAGAAAAVDNGSAEGLRELRGLTGGLGPAAAIDFVGAPATAQFGFDALRRGGTLVVVGLYGGAMTLPVAMLPLKMARIVGSYVGSLQEMRDLMAIVKQGKIAPIPIETRPLAAVNATLDDLRAGRIVGRVVLQP